jgi:multiple sugar transport system substrate-binding protein
MRAGQRTIDAERSALARCRASFVLACLAGLAGGSIAAPSRQSLSIAAYPAVDEIVRAAVPQWTTLHPTVDIQAIGRQFSDHHAATTTASSIRNGLPDVMALEMGCVGRFAQGGGLENRAVPPHEIAQFRARWVACAYQQATNPCGEVVAASTDIGPDTRLYRQGVPATAGVSEVELTRSWGSDGVNGVRSRAATAAYRIAHARNMKDLVVRAGIQPGEGLYFDQQSNVLVTSPRFVRAFELALQVRQLRLDAKVGVWSNEWSEGFKRGTIATRMTGAWLVGHLSSWLAPATKSPWRTSGRRIAPVNVHKQDAFASELIDTELVKVLERGRGIATALANAQRLLPQRAHR